MNNRSVRHFTFYSLGLRFAKLNWARVWVGCALLVFGFTGQAFAQSGATCQTATPISGEGAGWSFTGNGSTPLPSQGCGQTSSNLDSYFRWTAEESGDYEFLVYTGEAYSRYEIYQGSGCPGTFVACGGFSLSVTQHASIIPNVQAGDSFLVRGGFSYGFLQVTRSGNGCEGVGSDPFSGNQECATPAPIGNGTFLDLSVNRGDSDYYQVCVAAGDDLSVTLGSKILDNTYRLRLHDASVTPCDSNLSGSLIGESFSESIHYHNATSGPVDVRIAVQPVWWFWGCNRYDMTIAGANGCDGLPGVSTFCDPMDVNSTGIPTVLTATGGTGIHSGVRLEATQGSPNQFAMMLIGTGATNPGLAIGQGRLCLDTQSGNRFGRYNIHGTAMNSSGRFDANGVLQNLAGTSITGSGFDVPKWIPAINQVLRSGETWHFQLWHREPNGTSNFSNGVTVSFQTLPQ